MRIPRDFYLRDVLDVAPDLIGKNLVLKYKDGSYFRYTLTEVEAYRGTEDKACHASKGKTSRTSVMFGNGGLLYIYLIYGMYWMLNIVTGTNEEPQAALIRGIGGISGPGKLTKILGIDRSFYGEDLVTSERIWLEDTGIKPPYKTGPRIGIDYAGEYWKSVPWRYFL
ncbi:MAG: DNA-3-methyladenine glycosylase [Bacteroidetes bacterium]|nr:DNA-3-methyladenine glycosylase [Bacteroidota bacterium]